MTVEKGELRLFPDYRYFFYLTNDYDRLPAEIVFDANRRRAGLIFSQHDDRLPGR